MEDDWVIAPIYSQGDIPPTKPLVFVHHGDEAYVNEVCEDVVPLVEEFSLILANVIKALSEHGPSLNVYASDVVTTTKKALSVLTKDVCTALFSLACTNVEHSAVGVVPDTSELATGLANLAYATKKTETPPPATAPLVSGGQVLRVLRQHFHGLDEFPDVAACPSITSAAMTCGVHGLTVAKWVQHLNDTHTWTYDQIADWLESLDVDLTRRETPLTAAEAARMRMDTKPVYKQMPLQMYGYANPPQPINNHPVWSAAKEAWAKIKSEEEFAHKYHTDAPLVDPNAYFKTCVDFVAEQIKQNNTPPTVNFGNTQYTFADNYIYDEKGGEK